MKVDIEIQLLLMEQKYVRGIPSYLINLVKALKERNANEYTVSFFDYSKERNNRAYAEKYLGEYLSPKAILECNTLSYRSIMEGLKTGDTSSYATKSYGEYFEYSADIYHFPSVNQMAQNAEGKVITTVHDIMPLLSKFERYWTFDNKLFFKNAFKYVRENRDISIISVSENTKNDIVNLMNIEPERIFVTLLGYDKSKIYHETDDAELQRMGISGPFLLYLGALDYRKGIGEILKAFDIIKEKNPDIKLVLAGNPEEIFKRDLSRMLSECKFIEDVIMPGYVTEYQKRILLSSAKIFLFPSEYEGFGLPVIEAMACQTPVITTNISSIPEVGGDSVVYVSPNKYKDLADAIYELLDNESYREELIKLGYERAQTFSWSNTALQTEKVYEYVYTH